MVELFSSHKMGSEITQNYKSSSFGKLLNKSKSVLIHLRNLRALAVEIYKVMQKLSPSLLNEVFMSRQYNYNLRGNNILERRRFKSVKYDIESL